MEYDCLVEAERALTEGLDLIRWTGESIAHRKGYAALARLRAIQGDRSAMLEAVRILEETWPERPFYGQALRHCLSIRHWPDDADVKEDACLWLAQSGIDFDELALIDSVDPTGIAYFYKCLNTALVLARLAKETPGIYPMESVHALLRRQVEFAETHGILLS